MKFSAIIYVIDITEEVSSIQGGIKMGRVNAPGVRELSVQSNICYARKDLARIMAFDELRHIHTVAILLNLRQDSELHNQVFSKSRKEIDYVNNLRQEQIKDAEQREKKRQVERNQDQKAG